MRPAPAPRDLTPVTFPAGNILTRFILLVSCVSGVCAAEKNKPRYTAESILEGTQTVTILHDNSGGYACIRPQVGSTCTSLTLAAPDGKLSEMLTSGSARAAGTGILTGIPVLFPWPGRLADGSYLLNGKLYELLPGRHPAETFHGFVYKRAWHLVGASADGNGAWSRSRITSADCPETSAGYPFTWSLTLTHRLTKAGLTLTAEVENKGSVAMPFGLGFHPWLRTPIDSRAPKEDCLVQVPAASVWAHSTFDGITPSSPARTLPKQLINTVSKADDLRSPARIANRTTAVYSGLQVSSGTITCSLTDTGSGRKTQLTFSENLGTVVLFNPRRKPAFCIEPWSCPPNALNLFGKGIANTGITLLEPGATWRASLTCSLH